MSTIYPNTFLAFPFLSAENGVFNFWTPNGPIELSLLDLRIASVASIILFQDGEQITVGFSGIDPSLYSTGTPSVDDYVLYYDNATSSTIKTTIASLTSGLVVAPVDATYVTLTSNSILTNESILAASTGLSLVGSTFAVDFSAVQAKDATLTSIASLGTAADKTLYTTGIDTWAETSLPSFGRTLIASIDAATGRSNLGLGTMATQNANAVNITGGVVGQFTDVTTKATMRTDLGVTATGSDTTYNYRANNLSDVASASTARTNLGLVIGTNVQAYDATLQSISSLGTAADKIAYTTGVDTWAETALTSYGRSLIDDADAATARTTLGLGTLATQSGTFSGTSSGTNTGDQNLFSSIPVSGQTTVTASSATTALTLVAGANMTITTDNTAKTVTFVSSGLGGGGAPTTASYLTLSSDLVLSAERVATAGTGVTITDAGANSTATFAIDTAWAGQTALTTLGTIVTGTWGATAIATTKGGTGLTSYALGDILYSSATNTLAALAGNTTTTKKYLAQTGNGSVSAAPSWSTIDVSSSDITGTLAAARFPALTSDVTTSAGSLATTIASAAVTYAKMQNISATSRILGRKTAGAGSTEECTLSDVLDFVGSAAQGDILYRGSSTWTRLAAGTSGQVLQTQGSGANPQWATAAPWTYIFKTSDTSRSSTTTLTADPDIQFTMTANKIYTIQVAFFMNSTSTTPRFKVDFDGGAATTNYVIIQGVWGDTTSGGTYVNAALNTTTTSNTTVSTFMQTATITISVSGTGGVFSQRWAQQTSSGTATLAKAGSYLAYKQIN